MVDMSKTPEVRIKVTDLDRLAKLDAAQLKVWMYYKRREGADGKAWGKAATIAEWAGGYDPGTIRNARSWLKRNGWLRPNGASKSGLPMFLSVIPKLHPEGEEVSSVYDTGVISKLHGVSSVYEPEVPTQKKLPEKDCALTSASELVSEHIAAAAAHFPSTSKKKTNPGEEPIVEDSYEEYSAQDLEPGALAILVNLYPQRVPSGLDIQPLNAIAKANPNLNWLGYFQWNRTHKPAPLVFRSLDKFLEGWEYSLNDFDNHDQEACARCKKTDPSRRPNMIVDGKPLPAYRQESGKRGFLEKSDL